MSKLRGKPRLYRRYKGEDGKWHNQVLPVTPDDLATAEGVEMAKARWRHDIIECPCPLCGRPIQMTLKQYQFFTFTMLNRYKIGAFPTCSKECAEELVRRYERDEWQKKDTITFQN